MKPTARFAVSSLLLLLLAIPMGEWRQGEETLAQSRQNAPSATSAARSKAQGSRTSAVRSRSASARNRRLTRQRARASARRRTVRRLVLRPGKLIPRERVREIQLALIERGFLEGPPTGVYDARTVEAMKRFQQAEGIEVTGYPTAHALYRLGLHPAASSDGSATSPAHRSPPPS
ncbi:MAG: peptidoglycan-binding protein [Blastocatellia bacterium]|nr:peptidoglycan-binding protein [Blastocatellia bacterium]MCS7156417.1 peptidoglycan-binding protein [Blastocatellia bacterium]MCX7751232.1 peptidoglycan-binding protein [Blastocatellia bacterium]MDW8168943.1 peptidoglycan-binding domain-containing protein [Acidobacteriota bacterium]MDW8256704.1 peptidoglycan-binding domain-containing protein [Acidobacteriota bacterium]